MKRIGSCTALSIRLAAGLLIVAPAFAQHQPGAATSAIPLTVADADTQFFATAAKKHGREDDLFEALWVARYDGAASQNDIVHAVAVSPDGSAVFATGQGRGDVTNNDIITIAYNADTGNELWLAEYNGPGNHSDIAYAIGVSPDGASVFVTGRSWGSGTGFDYATIAYDAETGNERWVARYDGPNSTNDISWGLVVSPLGTSVFVTGQSPGPDGNDFTTIAYDLESGDEQWVARYAGPDGNDIAQHIDVSADGSTVFVNGYSRIDGNTEYDFATVAYDAETGDELWVAQYDGPAPSSSSVDNPSGVRADPIGLRVFVTGQSPGDGTQMDFATIAYDAETGDELWVARHDAAEHTDNVWDLDVSPDGEKVFVTGTSWGVGTNAVFATVAYDAETGSELWTSYFERPGVSTDEARAVGVSPDGSRVFVTGRSWIQENDHNDIVTVIYDAETGDELWTAEYDGPANGNDIAYVLAVGPDGARVYVAGESQGVGTGADYVLLAYGDTSAPNIVVDPASLAATLEVGEAQVQALTISNSGDATLNWELAIDDEAPAGCALTGWVEMKPSKGAIPDGGAQVAEVTLDAADLAPGVYEANLCLASNDPETPLVEIPVQLDVVAPNIAVDPASLTATLEAGEAQAQALTISNSGDATLNWELTIDGGAPAGCALPGWVQMKPSKGAIPDGGAQAAEVTLDAADLAAGVYEANLCLVSNDPETPLVEIPVHLTVDETKPPEDPIFSDRFEDWE